MTNVAARTRGAGAAPPAQRAVPARTRLMDAAEVLIAERGPAVSAREIAAHAGQRNNSAVIYHFGGHDELVRATLARRMDAIEARRAVLLDATRPAEDTVTGLMHIIVGPAFAVPSEQGATHYARFVEQIRVHPVISQAVPTATWPAVGRLLRRLRAHLPEPERAAQDRRIRLMSTAMFALMADCERRGELITGRGRRRAEQDLVRCLTGLLIAT